MLVAARETPVGENGGSGELDPIRFGLLVLELLFDEVDIFADRPDVIFGDLVLHGRD